MKSVDILAVRHVKQGIETERFRAAQPLVQITFIAAGLGLRLTVKCYFRGPHEHDKTRQILAVLAGIMGWDARTARACVPGSCFSYVNGPKPV